MKYYKNSMVLLDGMSRNAELNYKLPNLCVSGVEGVGRHMLVKSDGSDLGFFFF